MASTEFAGVVVKVDTVNMQIVGFVQVGGLPVDVRLSPDGSVFYVANQGRGGVSVVDPVAMKEVGFIKTGRGAHGLAVSRDTRSLYDSCGGPAPWTHLLPQCRSLQPGTQRGLPIG